MSIGALLNKDQAAKILGITVRSLDKYTSPRGPLRAVRIGGRVLFDEADLSAFISRCKDGHGDGSEPKDG